jgi:hypothetical protein
MPNEQVLIGTAPLVFKLPSLFCIVIRVITSLSSDFSFHTTKPMIKIQKTKTTKKTITKKRRKKKKVKSKRTRYAT